MSLNWDKARARDKGKGGERSATWRVMELKFDGECIRCKAKIPAGTKAKWHPDSHQVIHVAKCAKTRRSFQ